jgi:3-phosphoshikimate 1-carboxyvinyltransferase
LVAEWHSEPAGGGFGPSKAREQQWWEFSTATPEVVNYKTQVQHRKQRNSVYIGKGMSHGKSIVIRPAKTLHGSVRLPGDKSISHRYAMLGGIAEGTTKLENFSTGADCASTLGCLRALGVQSEREGGSVIIHGTGPKLRPPSGYLDCGNSGSTIRMLSGILAGQDFISELRGDESLTRRPMARIIKPLEMMGAKIDASEGGRPPLRITGSRLHAIDYKLPVASAQVKTSLLFAGLYANGKTRIEEPIQTRDHGEQALQAFGARLDRRMREVSIEGGQALRAIEATVPGDISSAAFFLCAAALFPEAELLVPGLLLNPTRARLLDFLIGLGLHITMSGLEEQHGELVGSLQLAGGTLKGAKISGGDTAALIDEIPVLAAIAPYTSEGIEIRDARELRVKESDRIASVATNLRQMGAEVEEFEDGLRVPGGQKLHGASIDSFGDHRIAMAFAVAALRAEGETEIKGADSAVISFPEFFTTLEGLVQR